MVRGGQDTEWRSVHHWETLRRQPFCKPRPPEMLMLSCTPELGIWDRDSQPRTTSCHLSSATKLCSSGITKDKWDWARLLLACCLSSPSALGQPPILQPASTGARVGAIRPVCGKQSWFLLGFLFTFAFRFVLPQSSKVSHAAMKCCNILFPTYSLI